MHGDRRRRLLIASCGVCAGIRPASAQPRNRPAKVGYLILSLQGSRYTHTAFVEGMRELGYADGANLRLEVADAQGDLTRLPGLARELVGHEVDVIVAANPAGVGAAVGATKSVPIVMGTMSDPVAEGFVASLARPGGNVTGVVNQGEDLIPKQFELMREVAPRARRVAFLISRSPALQRRNAGFLDVAHDSARQLDLESVVVYASDLAEMATIETALGGAKAGAIVVALDPVFHAYRQRVIAAAANLRLPAIYPLPVFSDDGGLLSYGFNLRDSFRRAAVYVDKILKGARPADLPVERPLKFELVVNLKTAKSLGVTLPQTVLLRADWLIE